MKLLFLCQARRIIPIGLVSLAIVFLSPLDAFAVTRYWIGSSGGVWSSNTNWSLSSGGTTCNCVPVNGDTVIFDSSGNTDSVLDSTITLEKLDLQSGYSSSLSVQDSVNLTIDGDSFSQSAGTFRAPSSTLTIKDADFTRTGGTYDSNSGTTVLDVGDNMSITMGGAEFHNLTIERTTVSGTVRTLTLQDDLTAKGSTTIKNETSTNFRIIRIFGVSNPILEAAGGLSIPSTSSLSDIFIGSSTASNDLRLHIEGDFTLADSDVTVTSPILFTGTADRRWSFSAGSIAKPITVSATGGIVRQAQAITLSEADQDLIVAEGTYDLDGKDLTVNGTNAILEIQSGGILRLKTTEALTLNTSTPVFRTGYGIEYAGEGTFTSLLYGNQYSNLSLNSGKGTWSIPDTLDINGQFSVLSGTFIHGSNPLHISGGLLIKPTATFTKSTDKALVILDGNQSVSGSILSNLGQLQIGASPDTITLANDLRVDALTIKSGDTLRANGYTVIVSSGSLTNSGTLETGGGNIRIAGNLENHGTITAGASTITLSGSFINHSTFTANTSTLLLDGEDQTLSGSTTFYNLTKEVTTARTLTFSNAVDFVVSNILKLKGAVSSLLSLRSDSAGSQWKISPTGSREIAYLDARDSNNVSGTDIECLTGCVDSGNNHDWTFTISSSTSSTSSTSSLSSVASSEAKEDNSSSESPSQGAGGGRGANTTRSTAITAFLERMRKSPKLLFARHIRTKEDRKKDLPPTIVTTGGHTDLPLSTHKLICRIQNRIEGLWLPRKIISRIARRLSVRFKIAATETEHLLLDKSHCTQ